MVFFVSPRLGIGNLSSHIEHRNYEPRLKITKTQLWCDSFCWSSLSTQQNFVIRPSRHLAIFRTRIVCKVTSNAHLQSTSYLLALIANSFLGLCLYFHNFFIQARAMSNEFSISRSEEREHGTDLEIVRH